MNCNKLIYLEDFDRSLLILIGQPFQYSNEEQEQLNGFVDKHSLLQNHSICSAAQSGGPVLDIVD